MTKEDAPQDEPSTAKWQTVTYSARAARDTEAPVATVRLENRYEALAALEEEEVEDETGEEATPRTPRPVQAEGDKKARRKKRRVIVIGDSILRGTEGPICCRDPSARKVYCLPGVRIQDVKGMLQTVIQPTDYYPMVLVHVGINDAARRSQDRLMEDYYALGLANLLRRA